MYKFINDEYEVLTKPLSRSQVSAIPEYKVSGVVEVALADMINCGSDELIDILGDKLVEECLITQMCYDIVGCSNRNTVLLLVCADIEDDFDDDDL